MKTLLTLPMLVCVCACTAPRMRSPSEVLEVPAYLVVPGNFHALSKVSGAPVRKGAGETIEGMTLGFGSGQYGFSTVRLDRSGTLALVEKTGDGRYRSHKLEVAAEAASKLLDGAAMERCLQMHQSYSAGVNDGSQAFLRVTSNRRMRQYWFDNYQPAALHEFASALKAWLQSLDPVPVPPGKVVDGFAAYHQD